MNRVITINLNGNAYQLEEGGYDALRAYLDNAAHRLEGNPDRDEIVADIEQAIAEKFRLLLGPNKTVVITREVESVLIEMGPVQDATAKDNEPSSANSDPRASDGAAKADGGTDGSSFKRLYTIREGSMIAGVCNGLAAYFNVDVTIVRILFVILGLLWGTGVLLYVVMAFIIPTANTSAEKAAAHGAAHTAQEFIRRAKAGYYEGMKTFNDKQARREWKRKFKQEMRGWRQNFKQEMHYRAGQWGSQSGPQAPHFYWGAGASFPFLGLVNVALGVVAGYALYSLVTARAVFGVALPDGVPLWVGIVGLILLWHVVASPFRLMWYGACRQGGFARRCGGPLGGLGDFLVGMGFLMLVVWLLDRYVPHFHEMLKTVPPLLHQAVDSVQDWLNRR